MNFWIFKVEFRESGFFRFFKPKGSYSGAIFIKIIRGFFLLIWGDKIVEYKDRNAYRKVNEYVGVDSASNTID